MALWIVACLPARAEPPVRPGEPSSDLGRAIRSALDEARYTLVGASGEPAPVPRGAAAFRARNPAQGYSAYFTDDAVHLRPARADESWEFGLRLMGVTGIDPVPAAPVVRGDDDRRAEYARGDVTEWYVNGACGLEQGFTIWRAAGGEDGSTLTVSLDVLGNLLPRMWADGGEVLLADALGAVVLSYGGLSAWDATGRVLPARLAVNDGSIRIIVDAADAAYPVTIDPLITTQQAKLTADDTFAGDGLGTSLSISGDTVLVGAPLNDGPAGNNQGSAYIFIRSGTTWHLQAKLTASDAAAGDLFGASVSISGDSAVIGACGDDGPAGGDQGSAYVFVRSGSTWSQQAKLTASDSAAGDNLGFSVSMSGDDVVVGAYLDDGAAGSNQGSAYVFVRNGTAWSQQQKLTNNDAAAGDWFGFSVSISGNSTLVGAHRDHSFGGSEEGSAYVFVRSGTTWTQEAELVSSFPIQDAKFGYSVSINGNEALVGSPGDIFDVFQVRPGTAYLFFRTGTTWSVPNLEFASDGAHGDQFGSSVCIGSNRMLIGAPENLGRGAAYVRNLGGGPCTQPGKLTAADGAANDRFGLSVSIDGTTAVVGADHDDGPAGGDQGSAYVFTCGGTSWSQQKKLTADDTSVDDRLGVSVDIDGNYAVAGAYLDDGPAGSNQGSAYVFTTTNGLNWHLQTKLTAFDGAAGDSFGRAVAINGSTVVVGAEGDDGPLGTEGSAYVFVRSGTSWTLQAKLTASDAGSGDTFGRGVDIDFNTLVVAAPFDDGPAGADQGSAYVFVRNLFVWSQQAKLTASDAAADDHFGDVAVSISGNSVMVGSVLDDGAAGADQGSAYVFVRNGVVWSQQQKLTAADAAAGDFFGVSVAIDGNTAVVGAERDDGPAGMDHGSAYVFVRSGTTWSQQAKMVASDAGAFDAFGAVAISGDFVAVGARGDDGPAGGNQGSVYVFARSGTSWGQGAKFSAADAAAGDSLGLSVAIDGDTVIVGAYLDDGPAGSDQGCAYVFRFAPPACPTCNGDVTGDGRVDGADIRAWVACVVTGAGCACTNFDGDLLTADLDAADETAAMIAKLLTDPNTACP